MTKNIKSIVCFVILILSVNILLAQKTKINVEILNNKFTHVDLVNAYGNESQTYASADIKDNKFSMTTEIKNDIYRFDFGNQNYFLVVVTPGETMNMTINADNLHQIEAVTGSKSMSFIKSIIDNSARKQTKLDSLNNALQKDPNQLYWSELTQNLNRYRQINDNISTDLSKAYDNIDSLNTLFKLLAPAGKLKKANLDIFVSSASTYMKSLISNYSPFDSFLETSDKLYDFKNNRREGHGLYSLLDKYLASIEQEHQTAQISIGSIIPSIKQLIEAKDEYTVSNQMSNTNTRMSWATQVVEALQSKLQSIADTRAQFQTLSADNRKCGQTIVSNCQQQTQAIVRGYQTEYDEADKFINSQSMAAILENKADIATLMVVDMFPQDQNTDLHETVTNALHEKYPTHPIVEERWKLMHMPSTKIGAMAPELAFPNPNGDTLRLSDLRGKVVLIDFWASWCGPCRKENPNVRNIYAKYHDQGFEVFSVSLDRDAASWKRAIEQDRLVWPNHVSDLRQWQAEGARIYGVHSIPATFLLDRTGRIVAKDLRGQALEQAVKEILAR